MATSKFKLKLNTGQSSYSQSNPPPANATQTPTTGIKLNFTVPSSAKTPKSATNKKRTYDELDAIPSATSISKKVKPTMIRLNANAPSATSPIRKGSIIRLKKADTEAASPSTPGIRAIKLKHKGKPPARPAGVGYDSECSDAEDDPAIEENLILRMAPGTDADYIRKAIEERKIGIPVRDGGADIAIRFFARDARRASVRVKDHFYGAVLVDLPCIIESMKSWDKKGWWKSADICQMLLVTGRVVDDDAAKEVPIPKEVDLKTWAYPHGVTPPMWNVRRRRFRKRASHKTIEQAEEEVEKLLAEDAKAEENGGSSTYKNLKWEELRRDEEGEDNEDVDDAEGDYDALGGDYAAEAEDDEEDEDEEDFDQAFLAQYDAQVDVATPQSAPEVVGQKNGTLAVDGEENAVESAAEDSQEVEEGEDEDASVDDDEEEEEEEEDDDDDDDDDEDLTEEQREKKEMMAQQKEEIAHLDRQIAEKRKQLDETANPLLRGKIMNTIKKFEEDRDVKKRGIGMDVGDEED